MDRKRVSYYRDWFDTTPKWLNQPPDPEFAEKDLALEPAILTVHPNDPQFAKEDQLQITYLSAAFTKGGRQLFAYFSGGAHADEDSGNYCLVIASDDGGKTWKDWLSISVIRPDILRIADTTLWVDDAGRLWVIWTQLFGDYDGRVGTWISRCDDPDAEVPVFTAPKRIGNGFVASPITVLSNGDWLLPTALWDPRVSVECNARCYRANWLADEQGITVYKSSDRGESWARIATNVKFLFSYFDEPDIVERRDGSLWMLIRGLNCMGECFSYDGGHTWTEPRQNVRMNFPNTRFCLRKLKSGNLLLVHNYKADMFSFFGGRNNLTALLSKDDGKTWEGKLLIDAREGSEQPWAFETDDGFIHITYGRAPQFIGEVLDAKITEEDILAGSLVNPDSYLKRHITKAGGIQFRKDLQEFIDVAKEWNIEM